MDAESGLQYNRARYLDSFDGRFISEDPISFAGGDANLYRYVGNNSVNFADPDGQKGRRGGTTIFPRAIPVDPPRGTGSNPSRTNPVYPTLPLNPPPLPLPSPPPFLPLPSERGSSAGDAIGGFMRLPSGGASSGAAIGRLRPPFEPEGEFDWQRAFEPYSPDPNSCQDNNPNDRQCIPTSVPPVLGGSYYEVNKYTIGGQAHHMPSVGVIRRSGIALTEGRAPTICMRVKDHALTDSHSVPANPEQADAIRRFGALGFEIVQGRDILEVRGKFGTRYDFGIVQMRNYTMQLITTHPEYFEQSQT